MNADPESRAMVLQPIGEIQGFRCEPPAHRDALRAQGLFPSDYRRWQHKPALENARVARQTRRGTPRRFLMRLLVDCDPEQVLLKV